MSDAETTAAGLVVSATSSNQAVVPDGNLVLGGAAENRTLMVRPLLVSPGQYADITVTVSDGQLKRSTTFKVTVEALYLYMPLVMNGA